MQEAIQRLYEGQGTKGSGHKVVRRVWPCRYDRVLVAETKMDASSSGRKDDGSPAGKGDGAFNALAKYIFGGNASGTKMQMTTPVFTDDSGTMQFVIDPSFQVGRLGGSHLYQLTSTPKGNSHELKRHLRRH